MLWILILPTDMNHSEDNLFCTIPYVVESQESPLGVLTIALDKKVSFKYILSEYPQHFIEKYEDEPISNQPNLFPVEIHLFFDVIAL